MTQILRTLITAAWLSLPALAQAGGTVVGIVSERSAAEVAAGAHRFLNEHSGHQVVLRTPEQIATLPDAEVAALWQAADAVLIAAVFGDQVGRLAQLLKAQPPPKHAPILALNADQTLTRLSRLGGNAPLAALDGEDLSALGANPDAGEDPQAHLQALQQRFPAQALWLTARAHYQGRTPEHMARLMAWLLNQGGFTFSVPEPQPGAAIRWYRNGRADADPATLRLSPGPAVAILDLDHGDRPGDAELLDASCAALETRGLQCFAVLARWGGASFDAVRQLASAATPAELVGLLSLQDFTVGGGERRREVTEAFKTLDVPVLRGLRLSDRSADEWRLSDDGVSWDSVHYRLAMPELQGISQPMVLAVAQDEEVDTRTGVRYRRSGPVPERVEAVAARMARWAHLRRADNADKRIALVYYNHPPGRHNIGADKLNVPESLFEILHALRAAGYDTGTLPDSAEVLEAMILEHGVNLPQDHRALAEQAEVVPSLSAAAYQTWFDQLPAVVRDEMQHGPIGYLHARLAQARASGHFDAGQRMLERGVADLHHLLEHHKHPAQRRALDLLRQFEAAWAAWLEGRNQAPDPAALRDALTRTGIPGLSGWGPPPGQSMVHEGRMLFPGLQFGKVFIGAQPPRGWEIDEELLHANTSFPPTHQYLGFYHWLRDGFGADALVYLGRHSTREFLPRRRAGLAEDDYPELLGGDLPLIYPYIVDGVGEGIQAKRRTLGVMISHLTPPMAATELYDTLLELRQLVESYEAAVHPDAPTRARAVVELRARLKALELTDSIVHEIAHELGVSEDDIEFDELAEDLLVHEAGHYLTHMQEQFMPLGLHVFGRDWNDEALATMITSMAGKEPPRPEHAAALRASPAAERAALLAALSGRFIAPGHGNDPLRVPDVLPTGRNFHALSSDLLPTRIAWALGTELAAAARARDDARPDDAEAVVLWASDTVRDEGVMVAFGLDMLGIRPVWNARGIVRGLERQPLKDGRSRRDVLFTTSGLFRDLYEDQLVWLDHAVRLALDGASLTLRRTHPEVGEALDAALASLPAQLRKPGHEPLEDNAVARRWLADTQSQLDEGVAPGLAGRLAALRVFGTAPGAYGAGINRLAGRSGAWRERGELAEAYIRRMGHAYGAEASGAPTHAAFRRQLKGVGRTYLGRSSNLYGLLDRDDGFDFQGGLSLAVEAVSGQAPDNRVLQHADPLNPRVETLQRALLMELHSRNLNPQWLTPLMAHGHAGARTLVSDFLENLWGWQVTNPEVIRSWAWDAVHAVYFEDRHGIGLDDFLAEHAHVKAHMQAILLVAAQREFWDADPDLLDALATEFAELAVANGLPGGGHSQPDHPMLDWLSERLEPELRAAFNSLRDGARLPESPAAALDPSAVVELREGQAPEASRLSGSPWLAIGVLVALLLLFGAGMLAGRERGEHP